MTVFSKTMANSLCENAKLLAELFKKDDVDTTMREIFQTAKMIAEINELIDLMNGSTSKECQEGPKENVTLTSNHLAGWAKYRKLAKTLKFYDSTGKEKKNIPTINGLVHNLSAYQDIWQTLKEKGFTSINMRQLNQDPLENFFGLVRQENGDSRNPTVEQFDAALKTILITRFSNFDIRGTNCRKDGSATLIKTKQLFPKLKTRDENAGKENAEDLAHRETSDAEIYFSTLLSAQQFSPPVLQLSEDFFNDETEKHDQYVASSIKNLFFKSKFRTCETCLSCVTATTNRLNYSYELSENLQSTIITATRVFQEGGLARLSSRQMRDINLQNMIIECDLKWVTCREHGAQLIEYILWQIIYINVRKRCNEIINESARRGENETANRNKVLQQASKVKWYVLLFMVYESHISL